jgi:hypothetical protein
MHLARLAALALLVGSSIALPDVWLVDDGSLQISAIAAVENIAVDYADAPGFPDGTRYKRGSGMDGHIVYSVPNGVRNVTVRGFAMQGALWSVLLLAGGPDSGPGTRTLAVVAALSSTSLEPADFNNGWAVWSLTIQELPSCPTRVAVRMTGEPAAVRSCPALPGWRVDPGCTAACSSPTNSSCGGNASHRAQARPPSMPSLAGACRSAK